MTSRTTENQVSKNHLKNGLRRLVKVLEHFFQKLTINSRGFQKCSQKWSAMFNWFSFLVSKNDLKNGPVRLVKSLDLEHFFFVNLALNRCSLKFSQNVLQWNQHSKFFLIDFFMIYSWTVSISLQTFVSATLVLACFASLRFAHPHRASFLTCFYWKHLANAVNSFVLGIF